MKSAVVLKARVQVSVLGRGESDIQINVQIFLGLSSVVGARIFTAVLRFAFRRELTPVFTSVEPPQTLGLKF